MNKDQVLAAMDDAAAAGPSIHCTNQRTGEIHSHELREARAAVAEVYAQRDALVDAAKQMRRVLTWHVEYRGGPNRIDAAALKAIDAALTRVQEGVV